MINNDSPHSLPHLDPNNNTGENHSPYLNEAPSSEQRGGTMMDFMDKLGLLGKKIKGFAHLDQTPNQEVDALEELSTLDKRMTDLRQKTMRRIYTVIAILSVGMFIVMVLVKWGVVMWKDHNRPEVPTKVQDLKLEVNALNKWQEMKDQQINQLGEDIKKVEENVDKKMTEVQTTISQELNNTTANINQSLLSLQSSNREELKETLNTIKGEIQNANNEARQYTDQRNLTIAEKIAQIESRKNDRNSSLDVNKLGLPPLPPLRDKNGSESEVNVVRLQPQSIQPYYVEENINDNTPGLDFSTLSSFDMNNSADKLPKMTIMAGVQKATLVAGAAVPTLQKGNDLTRVVWLSLNGPMLIANGHTENIKECIIQAAATGNFATESADIRLSKLSCSLLDEEGKYHKLVGNVKGWVYGENGMQGLKGRLVTKEGELIEKAIPLALLESAIKALENSTKKSSTIYAYPGSGTSSTSAMNNIQDSFTEGTTKTASTTLDKFSDYYLMILEQLNPIIELKAGREVSIWFEGGEQLKLEEYTPADVDFFENKGLEQ